MFSQHSVSLAGKCTFSNDFPQDQSSISSMTKWTAWKLLGIETDEKKNIYLKFLGVCRNGTKVFSCSGEFY